MMNFMLTGLEIYSERLVLTTQGPDGRERLLRTTLSHSALPNTGMPASFTQFPNPAPRTWLPGGSQLPASLLDVWIIPGRFSASGRQAWLSPGQKWDRIVLGWMGKPGQL